MNMLYLDSLILIKYLEKIMILVEFYIHKCKFSGKKTQFFFTVFYKVFKDRVKKLVVENMFEDF